MPKKRQRILSILGSSYAAIDAHHEELSYSHYMSSDYPDLKIKNFARSAHGVDYAKFVLDWMIYTKFKTDLILLEVPPPARYLFWAGEGYNIVSPEKAEGYFEEHPTNDNANLLLCEPALYGSVERVVFSTNYFKDGFEKLETSDKEASHLDYMHEKCILSTQYHVFNSVSFLNQLGWYEKQLKCKIFYYTHDRCKLVGIENSLINQSNFQSEIALEYMHKETENFRWDYSHFNSYGNEYFYTNYLKASPFGEAIENIL